MPGRHQQPSPRLGIVLSVIAGLAVVVSLLLALRDGEPETTTTIATTAGAPASTSPPIASTATTTVPTTPQHQRRLWPIPSTLSSWPETASAKSV